jgi:hypothetical protein
LRFSTRHSSIPSTICSGTKDFGAHVRRFGPLRLNEQVLYLIMKLTMTSDEVLSHA